MSAVGYSTNSRFASIVQLDQRSGFYKIVAWAGPSKKNLDDRDVDSVDNTKKLFDYSTLCLLRRSFVRYFHDLIKDYIDNVGDQVTGAQK